MHAKHIRDLRRRPTTDIQHYCVVEGSRIYVTTESWTRDKKGKRVRVPGVKLERVR